MNTRDAAPTGAIPRAAVVLRVLASAEPAGASTSEVARRAGLPRPTVHRILTVMATEGIADRDTTTDRWLLGPELFFLGSAAGSRYDVALTAQPMVRRLAQATGESAFYSARRGNETICLIREDGAFPLRSHVLHEGARFPLGVVSAGMVVLAHLDDREIDDYLARTDLTTDYGLQHSAGEVRRHIAATRHDGYATNPGLIVEGSWGMAAAVFDRAGAPNGALSLNGVASRFNDQRRPELGTLLLRAAHELTQTLANRRPPERP